MTRRVGIIQSCYVPWRGYFDFIDSVDLFVIYDDVQYSKGSWRNRNRVKTPQGLKWLTVPVNASISQAIDTVRIAAGDRPWREEHRRLLHEALEPAPFFRDALALWEAGVAHEHEFISGLNLTLTRGICEYLGIATPIVTSREFALRGESTERLISLLQQLGATSYLSGPSASSYLEESRFTANGIRLEYKSYDYPGYPQLWGGFEGTVTVLDMIANAGPSAREYLHSLTPDVVVAA